VAAKLPLVPDVATTARDVLLAAILLPLLVQWWSTYYPDAEPGGGGWPGINGVVKLSPFGFLDRLTDLVPAAVDAQWG
jgi:hypothetical protein